MFLLVTAGVSSASYADEPASGTPDLSICVVCHGMSGEGNELLNAPGLANLEEWYIERQLRNYRDGLRGIDPNDREGIQMRLIAESLRDESISQYARAVAAYPDRTPEIPLSDEAAANATADAKKGQAYYSHQCGACHGPEGKGIKALGAPGLAGLDDWYIDRQLDKFRAGIRGNEKGDTYGAQMVFYMNRLKNLEDLKDIIAYLRDPAAVD